jgi:ABC-type transport system substrate-binding protein
VTCTLSGSGKWSDNTDIKVDDIVATYQAFRENPVNDKMKVFLKNVAVVAKDGKTVEISSDEKNSLMLDLLTSPILRSDMIERIRTGRLGKDGYVTS